MSKKSTVKTDLAVIAKVRRGAVGPFPASKKPLADRPGLYIRISTLTGEACWAHWNGKQWGLWSNSKKQATARKGKFSKKPAAWYGCASKN